MEQGQLLDVAVDAAQQDRRAHDLYCTDPWMTRALLRRIPIRGRVLECCAGRGAIADVLAGDARIRVAMNEPYQECIGARWRLDATQPASWARWQRFDWVVTNPPFNLANVIVPLALQHARLGVAMVLRLSWFEPTLERADVLQRHVPALINMPRHDFRKNGHTDSVTSAWFVWTVNEGPARFGRFQNDVVTPQERDALIAQEQLTRW